MILAVPAGPALAEDSIYVPLFTYRTGPFAGSGTPIADGMHDYLTMLNERDGGIGGVKLSVDECETGYDTKKGLECYDSVKPKIPVIVNPWSTGITLSLIPKASVDKIPILSMAYGLSASAKGDIFPWIFNPPATYWDGLSEILKYVGDGSIDKLKGKTIGYLYFDAGFGKEPIPLFQDLAKDFGFTLKLYPVAPAEHAEPVGAMARRAPRQARFPGDVWLGRDERDRRQGSGQGRLPDGQVRLDLVAGRGRCGFGRRRRERLQDAQLARRRRELSGACRTSRSSSSTPARARPRRSEFGQVLYDRGVYNSMLIAEAIADAQKLTGKKVVTGEDVRRGLETINLDAARFKALGLEGSPAPFKTTCADHNSHQRDLHPAMGWREMGEDHRSDRPG